MKQIIQSFKTGETILEEVPAPQVRKGALLIQTTRSLVSLGTERMLVEFGKSNLIQKARQQPDKVKQVLDKIRTDGLLPTLEAVFNKLGEPLPLGYCNVGTVVAVGEGVSEFKIGDRVASNGPHAEFVCVPKNLVAAVPKEVTDEEATFTVIGSIGLQGIRLLNPTLGETVVVIGLGLIGLITAQLLIANGCRVIGVDIDDHKLMLAKQWGIIPFNSRSGDLVKFVEGETNGIGADGVIITASAKNNDIISQSARMSRKRGRIVLVGVIGLELSRAEFYEKELSFQVSCSYGPGRYDDGYEQRGIDYPLPFVRWTEKRNFEAVLQAIKMGKLQVSDLVTEIVPLENYSDIYANIGLNHSIASLLKYKDREEAPAHMISIHSHIFSGSKGVIGVIGAGNFTKMTMLPALKGSGAQFKGIASQGGVTATALGRKHGFSYATTNYKQILNDEEIDLVLITTRHNTHADMVVQALEAGKHVFVEKPLALNQIELEAILNAYEKGSTTVNVGFNRRFAPLASKMKSLLGDSSIPINIVATMNAGAIPPDAWVHDLEVGGGRIIGEACHFIDICTYLSGSLVKSVCMNALGKNPANNTDNASLLLKYENGSNAVINYFANGSKSYSKERIEIFTQERTLVLDNWRNLKGYGFRKFSKASSRQDKGHRVQFRRLIETVKNASLPIITMGELVNTTRASFAAIESLKTNRWVELNK